MTGPRIKRLTRAPLALRLAHNARNPSFGIGVRALSLRYVDVVNIKIRDFSGRLPVELWRNVFKHACVDGGQTGCALSLVSRRIRKLSAGIRLQSVCVIDLDRLRSLLHILERLPEDERHVRFLFIARHQLQQGTHERRRPRRPESPRTRKEREESEKQQQDIVQNWRAIYLRVLALIAPHVEALAIHIPHELLNAASPTEIHFPVLRKLVIGSMDNAGQLSSLRMPLLRHLHVFGYATRHLVDGILGIQDLEHVRFSGLQAVETFTDSLSESPARPSQGSAAGQSAKLVVAPEIPYLGFCGNSYWDWHREHKRNRKSLWQHKDRSHFGSIVILEPTSSVYDLDLAIKDWRDVIENGGEGAWGTVGVLPAVSSRRLGFPNSSDSDSD
jgi:hypothetical protein